MALEHSFEQPVIYENSVMVQGQKTGYAECLTIGTLSFDTDKIEEKARLRRKSFPFLKSLVRQHRPDFWIDGKVIGVDCANEEIQEEITDISSYCQVRSKEKGLPIATTILIVHTKSLFCSNNRAIERDTDYLTFYYDHIENLVETPSTLGGANLGSLFDLLGPAEAIMKKHSYVFMADLTETPN